MGQPDQEAFDPNICFVRLREVRTDGFVEFDFAVGEPDLSVELIMPIEAFHEFCRANRAVHVPSIVDATLASETTRRDRPVR